MGRFNSRGQFVSGNGGAVSYDGVVAGGNLGTCAQWLTDDLIIANVLLSDGWFHVGVYDVLNPSAGWAQVDARGANALAAGGGRWAGFQPSLGVFGHINDAIAGLSLQGTDGRGAGADDGTLATVANYQIGTGLQLNGVEIAPHQVCRQVQVLSATTAVWDGGGNMHVGTTLPFQRMRVAGDWRVFYTPAWGVVAHPMDRPQEGRVLTQVGYHHDAMLHADGRLLVGWSRGIQELPHEWVVVNALDYAITDLTQSVPQEPVPAIGKPCWLGWFEFQEPLAPAPHNCLLRVKRDGLISNNSQHVGMWVQGSTVEEIEAKAAQQDLPPVAYWDAREWPRWPSLPANAWCALQAYQRANESDADFEADLRRLITDASHRYAKVALVCQCYTSNAGNTTDLMGLPPIYARLARDFVAVTMLLVFSDEGRATGLNDHPEMRARWQELYDGITGEPTEGPPMSNGIVDGVCVDPKAYFFSLIGSSEGQPAGDWRATFNRQDVIEGLEKYGFGQQRRTPSQPADDPNDTDPKGEPSSRLFNPSAVCSNAKPRAGQTTVINGRTYTEIQLGVIQTPNCWEGHIDTVDDATQTWTWRPSGQPYVPIQAQPQPPTGDVPLMILDYQTVVRRSDPKGFTLYFDSGAEAPIIEAKAGFNDNAPPLHVTFPPPFPPQGTDGRYHRGFIWKPVISGQWTPWVWVKDAAGREGRIEGAETVTVTE